MKRWISVLAAAAVLVASPQPVHAEPAPKLPGKPAQADKTVTPDVPQHGDWYVVPSDAAGNKVEHTVIRAYEIC